MPGPSIKDVALRSGVSYKTVSRVINREPSVSSETRERVYAAIADLGYRPHYGARSLRSGRSYTIRFLIHQREARFMTNPFQNEIMGGVVGAAQQNGYAVMLELSWFPDEQPVSVDQLLQRQVDGTVMLDSRVPCDAVPSLKAAGKPAVVIANRLDDPDIAWVDADFEGGGAAMVRHLIELGHKRIAHITDDPLFRSTLGRVVGYRQALEEAGIPFDPDLVIRAGQLRHQGAEATQRLLDAGIAFTAIYCVNDLTAFGAIECLNRNGLRVPEDVSVTGFDDIYLAEFSVPPLTTVHIPWYEMGTTAIRMVIDAANAGTVPTGGITMPMKIMDRGSTAPPRR